MFRRYGILLLSLLGILFVAQEINAQSISSVPTYPTTINVLFVQKDTLSGEPTLINGQYQPDGSSPNPRPLAFDTEYLPNVVRYEIGSAGLTQARQAQAVAARNFAWHTMEYAEPNPRHPCFFAGTCDVTNSTDHQRYDPGVATQADINAVNATANLFLAYSDEGTVSDVVSFTQFSKNHDTAYTSASPDGSPYLVSVYDPITQGPLGHGQGLSQDGAML